MTNFQDVLRDVHDPDNHQLRTNASSSATVYVGTATLFAVVNTSASGQASVALDDSVSSIGFATVSVSNPTLYAVVNTSAPGVGNSIVTVANTPLSTQIIGNLTVHDPNVIDSNNSTTSTLAGDATYTGTGTDVSQYSTITTQIDASHDSATDGMTFEFSTDNSNWDDVYSFTYTAADGARRFQFPVTAQYFRVVYTNGSTPQTHFRVQTILHTSNVITSIHRLVDDTKIDRTAQLVKSAIIAQVNGSGDFTPIQSTAAGILKVGGSVDVDSVAGNITLSDSKTGIGLVSVFGGSIGVTSNTAWSDPNTYIGLTTSTLASSSAFIGLVTIANAAGNATLNPSPNYIGLTTSVIGNTPTVFVGTPTLFAVVNTSAAGQASVVIDGNVTLSDSKAGIGLVSVFGGSIKLEANSGVDIGDVDVTSNTAWSNPNTYIGLVTATIDGSVNTGMTTLFPGPNYIGLATVDVGVNNAWSDPNTYIGLVTATIDGTVNTGMLTIFPGPNFIGLVSVSGFTTPLPVDATGQGDVPITLAGEEVVLGAGANYVGLASVNVANTARSITGNLTLSDSKTGIGLVSVFGGSIKLEANSGVDIGDVDVTSNTAWANPNTYIGLVTAVPSTTTRSIAGNVTLSDAKTYVGLTTSTLGIGTQFIGLVTANAINIGTDKTLIHKNIELSSSSIATIAVAAGGNAIFKVTNLVLNSDATVRMSIKSGATYLTGNASIGITLNPGGGWVETGSPDSPSYIGLASGAAIVAEKFDMTGTAAKVGGKVIYFQE